MIIVHAITDWHRHRHFSKHIPSINFSCMFWYLQYCTVEILAAVQFLVYQYDFIVFTSIEVKSGILTGQSAPNWSPQSVCSSAAFGIQAVHNASVMTQLDGGHPILADDIHKQINWANNLKGMRQQCSNIDKNSTTCRNNSQKWTFVFSLDESFIITVIMSLHFLGYPTSVNLCDL